MRVKKSIFAILMVVLAIGLVTACGKKLGEKIQLQLNLQKGKSYSLRWTMDQEISQEPTGQKQDMTQVISMVYTFKVKEVDADGIVLVNLIHDSVLFKQDGPMGKIEYDSSNPPDVVPPMASGFADIVGQNVSMRIARDVHVKEVQGGDEMVGHIIEQSDIPDEAMKASMKESMTKQFGDQSMKEMMKTMTALYPGKPVGIGESWSKEIAISRGFPMIVDYTFTLKSRKSGVAIIEERSGIKTDPEAAMEVGPMKLRYDMSGDQKGTLEIDEATGWHIRSKWTQELSGKVKVEGLLQTSEGMSWPISVKSIMSLERID